MSTIILSRAVQRRLRTARSSLPEFIILSWIVIALGLSATVIVIVVLSALALIFLGVAWLVHVLPRIALLALCVTIIAAAVARVARRRQM